MFDLSVLKIGRDENPHFKPAIRYFNLGVDGDSLAAAVIPDDKARHDAVIEIFRRGGRSMPAAVERRDADDGMADGIGFGRDMEAAFVGDPDTTDLSSLRGQGHGSFLL